MPSQRARKLANEPSQEESKGTFIDQPCRQGSNTFVLLDLLKLNRRRRPHMKNYDDDEMPDSDTSALGGLPTGGAATAPRGNCPAALVLISICVTATTTTSLRPLPKDYNEKNSSDHSKLFIHFYQLIVAELFFIYKHFLRKPLKLKRSGSWNQAVAGFRGGGDTLASFLLVGQ